MIFGEMCMRHWPASGFDVGGLYETEALTGSEAGFFNVVRGLAERGHEISAFCKTARLWPACPNLAGASVYPLDPTPLAHGTFSPPWGPDHDAYLVWNEPDYLRFAPATAARVCSQQLNDFTYCMPGFDEHGDAYAMPSEFHRRYLVEHFPAMRAEKTRVIPNSINLEFFDPKAAKRPFSVAYCSSPDRGLHRLLEMWPDVRARVPGAELRVYYRLWPWYETVKNFDDAIGRRARYIKKAFEVLGERGENGIFLMGPVPPKVMAAELSRTLVMAYPCDPVSWTEGFSISTLDACAAACMPIISDADALGSIYSGVAEIVPGRPGQNRLAWIDAIVRMLMDDALRESRAESARRFAASYSRQIVSERWEHLLLDLVDRQRGRVAA